MKVIGLGSPDDVRIRFTAREIDVLVDVLRDLRAKATRDAADTYATTSPRDTRPIDDRHDRLRGLEGLLMQLEKQPPENQPGAILVAATPLMREIAHEAAREALERLHHAHERYEDHVTSRSRDTLLVAARTAKAWITTLTAVDQVLLVNRTPGSPRTAEITNWTALVPTVARPELADVLQRLGLHP